MDESKATSKKNVGETINAQKSVEMIDFSSISLQVGEMLQLQLHEGQHQSGYRHSVKLIGYLERRSLLVTAPIFNDSVMWLRAGQSAVLRCFSGRKAYAFTASVLHVSSMPFPHIHFTYPATAQSMDVRKSTRVKTKVVGSIWKEADPSSKLPCVITDLSFTGAKLSSTVPLGKVADALKLRFLIVGQGVEVYISPSVIIMSALPDSPGRDGKPFFNYGVEFQKLEEIESFALQVLVYQNILAT